MLRPIRFLSAAFGCSLLSVLSSFSAPRQLQVGIASHAFDHLGELGNQAETAAASGANILYVTGFGGFGYEGLPTVEEMTNCLKVTSSYLQNAKRHGITLAMGYVCATSIVKLETFDRNWSPQFRAQFHHPTPDWRQQDKDGHPLPSWYGGDYLPACMNNPDWRAYEKCIVRLQLEAGCDGIFFDNPTVHPQGCYCAHCMIGFADFLRTEAQESGLTKRQPAATLLALRQYAIDHPKFFMRFRSTIARNFLMHMRTYARTIKPDALITANNSLNSATAFYSQCRRYAYSIYEMSQAEDFVVVEDMSSQPRKLANGQTYEYGPVYKQLHAISHGKPVVAVTLAGADYHTPPNLVRLAMAEAAANDASYLAWPTWPENQRLAMSRSIRPQTDFLRRNAPLFRNTIARHDVLLFFPFRRWLETDQCQTLQLAQELSRAHVQFDVICEDDLGPQLNGPAFGNKSAPAPNQTIPKRLHGAKVVLSALKADFSQGELNRLQSFARQGGSLITAENLDWLPQVQNAVGAPSIVIKEAPLVRAVVRDQRDRTIVHLLNLDLERTSSFADKVTPVTDIQIVVRVPLKKITSVRALTADAGATSGKLEFWVTPKDSATLVALTLPRLEVATLLLFE